MLATVADVEAFTRRTISDGADEAACTRLIELVDDVIRGYTGQTLSVVTDDQVTLRGDGSGRWVLPQRPVTGVFSVTTWGGTTVADFDWTRWGHVGPPLTLYGQWNGSWDQTWTLNPTLTVIYDHGFEVIPGDIIAVVCSVVARQFDNPQGLRSQNLGSWGEVYSIPATGEPLNLALSNNEKAILNRYKRAGSSILVTR